MSLCYINIQNNITFFNVDVTESLTQLKGSRSDIYVKL